MMFNVDHGSILKFHLVFDSGLMSFCSLMNMLLSLLFLLSFVVTLQIVPSLTTGTVHVITCFCIYERKFGSSGGVFRFDIPFHFLS
jgi:hypothetical protein